MEDYCYVIRSQCGQDSFYVGQSTTSLTNNDSGKNRFFTHALNSMGVTNFGHQSEDFRACEEEKNIRGIDKIWHDYGYTNCTYYIFNRPGIDTLHDSCRMLLDYGFWAGNAPQREDTFSSKYSANIGEILLIDYFYKNGSSLLPGSVMKNEQAGGQSNNGSVYYSPARSKWGQQLFSNFKLSNAAVSSIRHKVKSNKKDYSVRFNGKGGGKNIDRLSRFLSNPASDVPCFTVTKNFLKEIITEKYKNVWMRAIKEYINNLVSEWIDAQIKGDKKSLTLPGTMPILANFRKQIDDGIKYINTSNNYINLKFHCDWKNSSIKIIGITKVRDALKKKIKKVKLKSYIPIISKVLQEQLKDITISFNFEVVIDDFSFIDTDSFNSALDGEIRAVMKEGNSFKNDIETAIVEGIRDALCYTIYKNRYNRQGILYRDDKNDVEVIKYSTSKENGDSSYYNWLRHTIASQQIVGASIPTWLCREPYWNAFYSASMGHYRKTIGAKFEYRDGKYLFSNISEGKAKIPEDIVLRRESEEPVKISSTNYTYFIDAPRLIEAISGYESFDENMLERCKSIF